MDIFIALMLIVALVGLVAMGLVMRELLGRLSKLSEQLQQAQEQIQNAEEQRKTIDRGAKVNIWGLILTCISLLIAIYGTFVLSREISPGG